jgi:heme/copper-type cytochrome/quinol oxidase subunit 2
MFLLVGGLVLLLAGVGIALSSMNQAVESPFITNVNSTWNTETVAIVLAVIGAILLLFGILILF